MRAELIAAYSLGLMTPFFLLLLKKAWMWIYYSIYCPIMMRIGWYQFRKDEGHPIPMRRATFGATPRFGAYEADEPGCPEWDRKAYALVADTTTKKGS